jgi:hypothetical protein
MCVDYVMYTQLSRRMCPMLAQSIGMSPTSKRAVSPSNPLGFDKLEQWHHPPLAQPPSSRHGLHFSRGRGR